MNAQLLLAHFNRISDAPGAIPLSIFGGAPENLRREMYEASIENAPNNIDRGSAFRRRKMAKGGSFVWLTYISTHA